LVELVAGVPGTAKPRSAQTAARFNLSAFVITETELKLIAAAAIIGLSSQPNTG
jgi:hypothetical protein